MIRDLIIARKTRLLDFFPFGDYTLVQSVWKGLIGGLEARGALGTKPKRWLFALDVQMRQCKS